MPDIQRQEDRVNLALQSAFGSLRRYLQGILDQVHASDNGLLARDEFNLALIDRTIRSMQSDVAALGFQEATRAELAAVADLKDEILDEYQQMDIPEDFTAPAKAQIAMLATGAEFDLVQVQAAVSNQLTQVLMRSTIGGLNLRELMSEISSILDINLSRAQTLITTTLQSFAAMVTVQHGRDVGIKWFRYDGPDDSVTREWCDHWVGRVGTEEMIEATADEWERDSQPKPAMSWRGGYNCRHNWVPLDDEEAAKYEKGPR
jgi:hypothetical protein